MPESLSKAIVALLLALAAALAGAKEALPEAARDVKLNLEAVLQEGSLTPAQRWGVAVTSAATARNCSLLDAVVAAARAEVGAAVIDDALAAAALMAMNNIYYRFRHMMGASAYAQKPARLRMNRLARPKGAEATWSSNRWRPAPSTGARSACARTRRRCARPASARIR